MSLYTFEEFVLPGDAQDVDVAYLEAHDIDPTGVFAYRVVGPVIEWWVVWTHPVTGRVYVEEKQRIDE